MTSASYHVSLGIDIEEAERSYALCLETVEGPHRQCEACERFVPARQIAHGECWECRAQAAEERRAAAARHLTDQLLEARDEMRAAA